jgi:hypothetical protein
MMQLASSRVRMALLACLTLLLGSGATSPLRAQTSDTMPPQLVGMTFSPSTIDVTLSAQTVTFQVAATDNLSGLRSTQVDLRSPSGIQTAVGVVSLQGNPLSGTFVFNVTVPRYSEPGMWSITQLRIWDAVGNSLILSQQTLAGLGYPVYIEVIDLNPDLTPPTLTAIRMTPGSANVTSGDVTVVVELDLQDPVSGVNRNISGLPDFELRSPSGQQNRVLTNGDFNLAAGTVNSGTWRSQFVMPRHSEPGVWQIVQITVRDLARNTRRYTATDLAAFGSAINFPVTSPDPDMAIPVLTGLRYTPAFVNTSTGPQAIQVEMDMTDNLAGVDFSPDTCCITFGAMVFRSPSGAQAAGLSSFGSQIQLVSGTLTNGTWRGTLNLPQFSEEGDWWLSQLYLKDFPRNRIFHNRQSVEALGLPGTFVVIKPSLTTDGTVGAGGGTVTDEVFGTRASVTFPPGAVSGSTEVAIDVLQTPIQVPLPTGFSGAETYFVNIQITPQPAYPLPPPGLTVVLPLKVQTTPGKAIYLYRINPTTGLLEPAYNTSGVPVVGYVNADGLSATFTGISALSTVVGLLSGPVTLDIDIRPDDANNVINLRARGVLPVLIYSTPTLDATKINLATLRLAGASVATIGQGKPQVAEVDHNMDGLTDLLVFFRIEQLQLGPASTEARLEGVTLDLREIRGVDKVRITGPGGK